jgi:hypothetical protein
MVRKFNRTTALAGAIFLGSLAWSTYVGAAEPNRQLPETGRIDMISPDRTSMVIDDRLFQLSPYVHVWTSKGTETSLNGLKAGTTINFNRVNQGQPGRDVITEIQVTAE